MSPQDATRQFAVEVVRRLTDAGFTALWAGGCVRDYLLGREPDDYDVATSAHPEDVRRIFGHRKTLTVGASFGVIIVRGPRAAGHIEVATFRTEGPYLDGRRPENVAFSTPEDDAHRRDFTINGMFFDPIAQKILDFVGGERDLGAGMIRAIGDPHDRMREDKLRMLRAVRFTATLDFELDSGTADAVREMAPEIHLVSSERIAQELKRMLVDTHRRHALELAHDVGLLLQVLPELQPLMTQPPHMIHTDAVHSGPFDSTPGTAWQTTLRMLQLLRNPSFELAAAALFHAIAHKSAAPASPTPDRQTRKQRVADDPVRQICRRLRLSNQETDHICWLTSMQDALNDAPQQSLATLKRILAHARHADLVELLRVKTLAQNGDLAPVVFCEEYVRKTPQEIIDPPALLTGDVLIAQGFKPGRWFKSILDTVRDAQLNGDITTPVEALELARELNENSQT